MIFIYLFFLAGLSKISGLHSFYYSNLNNVAGVIAILSPGLGSRHSRWTDRQMCLPFQPSLDPTPKYWLVGSEPPPLTTHPCLLQTPASLEVSCCCFCLCCGGGSLRPRLFLQASPAVLTRSEALASSRQSGASVPPGLCSCPGSHSFPPWGGSGVHTARNQGGGPSSSFPLSGVSSVTV